MKIPKYIEKALERRARAAHIFSFNDAIISRFIRISGVDANDEDYCGGVESIAHPISSNDHIRQAILQAGNFRKGVENDTRI